MAVVLAVVISLALGGALGAWIGHAGGSSESDEHAAEVADLTDQIADLQAERTSLRDQASGDEGQLAACALAVSLAQDVIDNRQADLDFYNDPSLPEDPLDPVYDEALERNDEFRRLVGGFDVSAALCLFEDEEATAASWTR